MTFDCQTQFPRETMDISDPRLADTPVNQSNLNRRSLVSGMALSGVGLAMPGLSQAATFDKDVLEKGLDRGLNPLNWLSNRGRDSFQTVYEASTGVVAARCTDFSIVTPEGSRRGARIAYPLMLYDRLPLIVFCPDAGSIGANYDPFIAALAASGYFVLAIDDPRATGSSTQSIANPAKLRLAEARFFIDQVAEAAKVLGGRASRVSAARVGVAGHGEGAWMALSLAGWGSSTEEIAQARDGRVMAAFGLAPSPIDTTARVVDGAGNNGGTLALMAGHTVSLPTPLPGSGILSLELPNKTPNFGGLIGRVSRPDGRKAAAAIEPAALAASVAAAAIFFDWGVKRQNDRKRTLLGLDGRVVDGLSAPLRIGRA
jgi:hypothetical protein